MWGTFLFYSFWIFASVKQKIEEALNRNRYDTNLNFIWGGPGTGNL